MFILTSTLLCIYVFVFSLINIVQGKGGIIKAMSRDVVSDFLIVYSFIAVWFVGGLTIFHFYLISTNQTTYENFRYQYNKENPYHKGRLGNFKDIFFSKIPPSLNDFRAYIHEEESAIVSSSPPNLVGDTDFSKEKIDVEMGAKLSEESILSLPEILKNFNFDDLDNESKSNGNRRSDSSLFYSISDPDRDSTRGSGAEVDTREKAKRDEGVVFFENMVNPSFENEEKVRARNGESCQITKSKDN